LKYEQAQLVPLSCSQCGGRDIQNSDDAVFFFCNSCQAVLEPRGGELALLPCLWEKVDRDLPEGSIYVPFWVYRTEAYIESKKPRELKLKYPADFMIPASILPERPVSIVRLADRVTSDEAAHQYTTQRLSLDVELGRYSREDALQAVELVFLSVEREMFSEAPGTKYDVRPSYKNLCFLVWEKSRLDLLHVPDEHILLQETAFEEEIQKEERIDDFISLISKELTRKRYRL
jgi:ribosomal protein S27E